MDMKVTLSLVDLGFARIVEWAAKDIGDEDKARFIPYSERRATIYLMQEDISLVEANLLAKALVFVTGEKFV